MQATEFFNGRESNGKPQWLAQEEAANMAADFLAEDKAAAALVSCHCGRCHKAYKMRAIDAAEFGRDALCNGCLDWDHVRFMQTTGAKLGFSCVAGCRCGRGAAAK